MLKPFRKNWHSNDVHRSIIKRDTVPFTARSSPRFHSDIFLNPKVDLQNDRRVRKHWPSSVTPASLQNRIRPFETTKRWRCYSPLREVRSQGYAVCWRAYAIRDFSALLPLVSTLNHRVNPFSRYTHKLACGKQPRVRSGAFPKAIPNENCRSARKSEVVKIRNFDDVSWPR